MGELTLLKIKEIKFSSDWDRFVKVSDTSGYPHLFNWCRVIQDAYNHKCMALAAVKKGQGMEEICGILPLYRFKRGISRPRLVSVPFFDTAGILARDREIESFLLSRGISYLNRGMVSGMELRQDAPLACTDKQLPGIFSEVYDAKVGLSFHINGSQERIMAGFKSKLRNQIRKGQKNGLTWRIGKKELLDPFYAVFTRNMRDLGSPVHSKRFFKAIFTWFYHHGFILVVYYRSKPVAASFLFRFKKSLANPWASSIKEFRYLNSNIFLYWQMIRFACNMGMESFDMGRSSKGASTYRFKKQWGPEERRLYWYRWESPGKETRGYYETLTIDPWKKMPLPLARDWI